jgi:hypothetical protein
MALKIEAFANSDDALVVWRSPQQIPDCTGFELRRKRNGKLETVRNRVSFSGSEPDPNKPESSATSPIRRYAWTDHEVNSGDKVSYQVAPVIQSGNAAAAVDDSHASPFSAQVELTGEVSKSFECYFNRGLVISQFMSHALNGDLSPASLNKFKASLNTATENKIRVFLGGDLRARLIGLLDDAKKNGGHIFAALYELSDEVLIARLKSLGSHAHIVLSNGTHKSASDDGNSASRAELKAAHCDVHDRLLPAKVLGHNKFMVLCDKKQKPTAAWTGSTNWSPTGLCTQINNGILIKDAAIAQIYLDQWNRLKDAGNATPPVLVTENSKVKSTKLSGSSVDVWFTRSSNEQEMNAAINLIKGAQQGIVFLMFEPGNSPMLNAVLDAQAADSNLFVKGVISTMNTAELDKAHVSLIQRDGKPVKPLEVIQPQGLQGVGEWAAEVTRAAFLSQIGFAIVHSKMIVIDPNGKKPIVITGSHNFSAAASSKNDENLVIIQGDTALSQAYAVNVQSVFDHYNFRAVAKTMKDEGKNVIDVMKDPKSWQKFWFQGDKKLELDFWIGGKAAATHP